MSEGAADAEDLFAEYIARYEQGEVVELREYVERWPDLADKLRELEEQWRRVARIVRRAARGQSLAEKVATQFGAGADPKIALNSESDGTGAAGLRAVISSIRGRVGASERYRIKDQIGKGGMGIVMRVWDVELKRNVAMKLIRDPREKVGWPGFEGVTSRVVSRFIEEAQITSQLDHPGIVPVHEIGIDDDGRLYFTMRLVRGQSLDKILEPARRELEGWNRTRLLGVLLKACEALAYAHDKGVVHRDLKPSNIMVGRFGEVYVMDWGLARPLHAQAATDLGPHLEHNPGSTHIRSDMRGTDGAQSPGVTRDGDIMGTSEYMPPEQARGAVSQIGTHCDVYAMGAVLYQLLCGHSPYQDSQTRLSPDQVLVRLLEGPPRAIEELAADAPPELLAICRKAMLRDPLRRYATMLDFADDLRAFLEHRVVRAYRTDWATSAVKWIARNRGTALTGAIGVVLLVVGSIAFLVRLQGKTEQVVEQQRVADRVDHRLHAEDLIARAELLYPTLPATVPALTAWKLEADALLGTRAEHTLELANAQVRRDTGAIDALDELEDSFAKLAAVSAAATARIAEAQRIERVSLAENHEAWRRAIREIQGAEAYASPDGAPFVIEPQLGLVPLGLNPHSHLAEFWLIASGAEPVACDPASGNWHIEPETGIVLVLMPGNPEFVMGSDDEAQDKQRRTWKTNLHPFLLSKYETTQGQWRRCMGENPAYMSLERPRSITGKADGPFITFDDTHPIESISRVDAEKFCRRLGVQLATEARWEYACRAGTSAKFWTGEDELTLIGAENILHDPHGRHRDDADRFFWHAPVGSFLPNPFGFFDMHGNVAEWCRDEYDPASDAQPRSRLDGSREIGALEPQSRWSDFITRGGTFERRKDDCRSAARGTMRSQWSHQAIGVRVAMPLEHCPRCAAGAVAHD